MKPKIVKTNRLNEVLTPERCFVAENYSSEEVSIAHARVKPGITTIAHHLNGVKEMYIITKGEGQVDVGDLKPAKVSAGDMVIIPAGYSQRITNIGKADLEFFCVCTPRFTAACYCNEAAETNLR